ncbi:serine palmitoyltransferase [Punctularia strigosozonata HHB-11173 SS5]|uniref:serine palmitoyltransferase n=1 Tax=Punctularia strigosozonata (strain HHB-11173) TaxID=741275 RepID=UPI00044179BD|nr:serine palmitoyltransferase [Punctularia strigosozonata HHB-11173 SS5]EIN14688.1 serine palmitoyltransferase [Punctularia strigosozonata HHB-11173 SS5]
MDSTSTTLEPLLAFLTHSLHVAESTFYKIPGSAVVARYVRSSHQNDPGRTLLEIILIIFAIRTLLQSRTRGEESGKHFIQFSDKEIDELVDEWAPEPLCESLNEEEQSFLDNVPVIVGAQGPKPKLASTGKNVLNLSAFNFTGLAGNEEIKQRAVETLRKYGLGSCGPCGFYGTLDVHMDFERDVAEFLGTESAILYSQGFSTISSVIPAFAKRGDVIIADRGVSFPIQLGIRMSRSTVRWYDHNDLNSLEEVLQAVDREHKKRKLPLTRRFIVSEGVFEKDGSMVDLPKLIELKYRYKYRLILDESFSFGTLGRTGRGLTELYNVPASQVEMLVVDLSKGLGGSGGFCAGSRIASDHQRANATSYVFSASMPGLLAVSASESINILRNSPSILSTLQENIRAVRAILDRVDCLVIPSHPASPIIHLYPTSIVPTPAPSFDVALEERLLQEIVDEALAQGVLITRAKRLRGQEMVDARPSIRLAITAALTRKECEKAANLVKAAAIKVLGRRR